MYTFCNVYNNHVRNFTGEAEHFAADRDPTLLQMNVKNVYDFNNIDLCLWKGEVGGRSLKDNKHHSLLHVSTRGN